MFQIIGT